MMFWTWSVVVLIVASLFALLNVVDIEGISYNAQLSSGFAADYQDLKIPRLSGFGLKVFETVMSTWPLNAAVGRIVVLTNHFYRVRVAAAEHIHYTKPTFHPRYVPTAAQLTTETEYANTLDTTLTTLLRRKRAASDTTSFHFTSLADYVGAYEFDETDAIAVATAFIAAVKQSNSGRRPLRAVVAVNETDLMAQAAAAVQRRRQGRTLSLLDGVPVLVKEELHAYPYITTCGTSWAKVATSLANESSIVHRLRDLGMLIAGKTNMHEIGLGTIGQNHYYGTPRNPNNLSHHTGGSSAGSAAAVAAGLAPVALGADGGGSIRIPASFQGLVGLKATYGRISGAGAFPLAWTVAHDGAITNSVLDAAIIYASIAGNDPRDEHTLHQPPVHLHGITTDANKQPHSLAGVRVGVFLAWNNRSDPDVADRTAAAVAVLRALGATIVDISISHLFLVNRAHNLIILSEMNTAMNAHMNETFSEDVRIALQLSNYINSDDYIAANIIRTLVINLYRQMFIDHSLNFIITPTSATTAPPITITPSSSSQHESKESTAEEIPIISDLSLTDRIMRFATFANLLGIPALTVPFGYNHHGLPIGIQLMGAPWSETELLRYAYILETYTTTSIHKYYQVKRPELYYSILDNAITNYRRQKS